MPERWREEVFLPLPLPEGIGPNDTSSSFNHVLPIRVYASGNDFDQRSPYGVSMHLIDDGTPIEKVRINAFTVSIGAKSIQGLQLQNSRSQRLVEYGADSVELDHAPCCVFLVGTSQKFHVDHVPNEVLTVTVDICIAGADKTDCFIVERLFRAVVRKGNFRMTEV